MLRICHENIIVFILLLTLFHYYSCRRQNLVDDVWFLVNQEVFLIEIKGVVGEFRL